MITVKVVSSNRKRFFIRQGVCFFLLLLENCDIMIKNVPLLMENSQNAPIYYDGSLGRADCGNDFLNTL